MANETHDVYDMKGRYKVLKTSKFGEKYFIYLGGSDTGYRRHKDGNIYTQHGRFVSKEGLLPAMKAASVISRY